MDDDLRTLEELTDTSEPAWPVIEGWIARAENPIVVCPVHRHRRKEALVSAQVTTRSPMGAIIFQTGGLLVDSGWLRILGSGSEPLPRAIHRWNFGRSYHETGPSPDFYLIADDAAGGFFAINGGAFGAERGRVFYHAPDTLEWEPLGELGYSDFLQWAFSSNLGEWSEELRWPGWQDEVRELAGDQAMLFSPPLWSEEGSIAHSHRRVVSVATLYSFNVAGAMPFRQ